MKNIEKYYDVIKHKLQTTDVLNLYCTVNEIRTGCDDCPEWRNCRECCLKNFEWLNQEYKEEILSDDEKEVVRVMLDFIHKFGCTVIDVKKIDIGNRDSFISIRYENPVIGVDDTISSPIINNDKFKGMELNRKYTLEELGLENVNG